MRAVLFALLVAVAVSHGNQQPAGPLPNDHDACIVGKNHDSCKRYYRTQCLDGDATGCDSYAAELSKDCPKPLDGKPPDDPAVKKCAAQIKCWQDRALSLAVMHGSCASDPRSPNCESARIDLTTAANCDSQQ